MLSRCRAYKHIRCYCFTKIFNDARIACAVFFFLHSFHNVSSIYIHTTGIFLNFQCVCLYDWERKSFRIVCIFPLISPFTIHMREMQQIIENRIERLLLKFNEQTRLDIWNFYSLFIHPLQIGKVRCHMILIKIAANTHTHTHIYYKSHGLSVNALSETPFDQLDMDRNASKMANPPHEDL